MSAAPAPTPLSSIDFTRAVSVAGTGLIGGYVAPKFVGDKPLKSALSLGAAAAVTDLFQIDTYVPMYDPIPATTSTVTGWSVPIADGIAYSAIEAARLKDARRMKKVFMNILYGGVVSGISSNLIEPTVVRSMGQTRAVRRGRNPLVMTRTNDSNGTRAPGFAGGN